MRRKRIVDYDGEALRVLPAELRRKIAPRGGLAEMTRATWRDEDTRHVAAWLR